MELELQTFDQRFGKFEGVQEQHDQRLAAIEHRLGTIEVLIRDIPAEGHREREALRTALTREIHQARVELAGQTESVRTELHQTRDELTGKIDNVRTELTSQIESYRREVAGVREEITGVRVELNGRIDQLSNKIDGLYKWIIGILIAVGMSVIASLLKELF